MRSQLEASSSEMPPTLSINTLDTKYRHPLARAVQNLLSAYWVQLILAELIDGLPITGEGGYMAGGLLKKHHPLRLLNHHTVCGDAKDKSRRYCRNFDPNILLFNAHALQGYRKAPVGSREFRIRLFELVAAALHQIAVLLFQSDDKVHTKEDIDDIVHWRVPSTIQQNEVAHNIDDGDMLLPGQFKGAPREALYYHCYFTDHLQYPNGVADVAAYWAEDRIFGGVVKFDRGDSGSECLDIYLHPGQVQAPLKIWKLLDDIIYRLTDRLLSKKTPNPHAWPLPIFPIDEALIHGYEFWDLDAHRHIFRDPWELKTALPPELLEMDDDANNTVHASHHDPAKDGDCRNNSNDRFHEAYNSRLEKVLNTGTCFD